MQTKISLIVAGAKDSRIIGNEKNEIPWPRLKGDMQHFRAITIGNPVIMGRVTFETLKNRDGIIAPLPNRTNIVVTRDINYRAPEGVYVTHSIIEALEKAQQRKPNRICIIGGQQIYELTIGIAQEIFYTEVDVQVEGTTRFPKMPDGFRLLTTNHHVEETLYTPIEYDIQYWVKD